MNQTPRICVVGSLNVDHTLLTARLPKPGETVTARSASLDFGGKGANQAVAAIRAGGQVALIGCVADDEPGRHCRARLSDEGIDTSGIMTAPSGTPSGSAMVVVDREGENLIVVNPGANACLGPEHIDRLSPLICHADVLLLQLECQVPTVQRAIQVGRDAGVKVIVNPSPWDAAFLSDRLFVDVLITNETEAALLTGKEVEQLRIDPCEVCAAAQCNVLIITRGKEPTQVFSRFDGWFDVSPPAVTPVDTVGAGDTFAGAFAVGIGEGRSLREAVGFANSAAALATLKVGAQAAIPTREQIFRRMQDDAR